MKITLLLLLLTCSLNLYSQSDTTILLKKKITYYQNGVMKKSETFRNDKTSVNDFYNNQRYYTDTCRDGLYKEWFPNGKIKVEGQYEYIQYTDTQQTVVPEPPYLSHDTIIYGCNCFKTGIWYDYDSIGKLIRTSRYNRDEIVFKQGAYRDTLINVYNDSVRIKLKDYMDINSYVINRSKNNSSLVLEFPYYYNHNYWAVYDTKKNLYDSNFPLSGFFSEWSEPTCRFALDDTGLHQYYYDFAKLKPGKYFVYYFAYNGTYYEIEITINKM